MLNRRREMKVRFRKLRLIIRVLAIGLLCIPIVAAYTYSDYENAIAKTADRLLALQSSFDYGWDWIVTGLTSHSVSPSATNLYGVTAMGLIDAYQKVGTSTYLAAAKNVADFIAYGDPSAGDFWNGLTHDFGHGSSLYWWAYSFDYRYLIRFSTISGDMSYKTYALAAWAWQKANIARYSDGSQGTLYSHFVSHVNDGFAGWGASDYGLAAWEMGDTSWAQGMASTISSNLASIISSPTYNDLGAAWSLKLLVTVDPTTYASDITSLKTTLKTDQHVDGYWSDGNSEGDAQTTAYAVMGLLTAGEYDAARKGAEWLLANQMVNGGWDASPTEYSETDSEAMQALASSIPPVGGFWVPMNKFELLAPWITLASSVAVAAASVVYVKRRKKQQN